MGKKVLRHLDPNLLHQIFRTIPKRAEWLSYKAEYKRQIQSRVLLLMAYPRQTIPVMSLYDTINDEKNSSLTALLIVSPLWWHQLPLLSHTIQRPKQLRIYTIKHQNLGGGRVSNSRMGISWWRENSLGLHLLFWHRRFGGGGSAATQLLPLGASVPVCRERKCLPLLLISYL